MVRTKTKPFLKRKKVPKFYFHFGQQKSVLPSLLAYTWRCENITTSPMWFEIKNTTDTAMHVSFLDPRLEIDKKGSIKNETLRQKHDFNFPIVNFPLIGRIFLQYLDMEYISLS
jgi:hypothetical protein